MPSLKDLGLANTKIDNDVTVDTIPEQLGSRPPFLQPGPYIFRLPGKDALDSCFAKVTGPNDSERIAAVFNDGAELTIVQAANKDLVGASHRNRVNNRERKRGKGEDAKSASDFDYLLVALGEPTLPKTNQGYAQALIKHAGKTFGADIELSAYCNEKRAKRIEIEGGQTILADGQDGRPHEVGCGTRYYQRDLAPAKDAQGQFPSRTACACGAILYLQEDLVRFRKAAAPPPAAS